MKKRTAFPWGWVAGIVALSFVIIWPLLQRGFFVSDDGEWMVIRLSAFYQSLASGQFPVRYLGRLNNSYGYPVANFLYPGFMYIGSMLHRLGISFPDSVKVIMGGSIIGSALLIFFALRRRFRSWSSFIGTLSFLFAPYLLYDVYKRGSVGEVLALLPSALLLFAVSSSMYWLIPPALGLLIVSHNTTALLFGGVFVIMLIIEKRSIRFVLPLLIGAGMASFFWVPALLEQSFVRFDSVSVSNPSQYFVTLSQALLLGVPTILSMPFLFVKKNKFDVPDRLRVGIVVCAYLMAIPVSMMLWQLPILDKVVQFPYRFLIIPVLLGPWVVASAFDTLRGWKTVGLFGVYALLWIVPIIGSEQAIQFVNRPMGYYTTNEGTTTVADEYMPRWVREIPRTRLSNTLDVINGDANLSERQFTQGRIEASIVANEDSMVEIHKIYYPGWGVTIDGVLTPIDYSNPFGFMHITVPKGTHVIQASFRETPERFIADLVSIASVILYLVFVRRMSRTA